MQASSITTSREPHVDEPRAAAPRSDAGTAPRHDIYVRIHKALRLCMTSALASAGNVDPQDDAEVARVAADVRAMLALARGHLAKEEKFIHPLMEARRPGSAAHASADHAEHLHAFAGIESAVDALSGASPGPERDRCASALYRTLARFVADNFVHMDAEESDHNAVLWATCTDDEILAVERQIVASLPPDEAREVMHWMAKALDPKARGEILAGMRQAAPAPVFEGMLAMVRGLLSPADRRKLDVALAA
jgi:hypothetical protein